MNLLDYTMTATLMLVCGLAFARGRWPERVIAAAMLINYGANFLQAVRYLTGWSSVPMYSPSVVLTTDLALLAVLGIVGMRARPLWTLFPAAFQVLATIVSVIYYSARGANVAAYVTAQNTFWWLTLIAVAYGIWETRTSRRSRLEGGDFGEAGGL